MWNSSWPTSSACSAAADRLVAVATLPQSANRHYQWSIGKRKECHPADGTCPARDRPLFSWSVRRRGSRPTTSAAARRRAKPVGSRAEAYRHYLLADFLRANRHKRPQRRHRHVSSDGGVKTSVLSCASRRVPPPQHRIAGYCMVTQEKSTARHQMRRRAVLVLRMN